MTSTIKNNLNQTIDAALDWRYAVKKFDPARKISSEDWTTLKHAFVKSPSSYGLQPYKFLHVESPALREKLKPVSWGQTQITDASHLVVLLARDAVTEDDVARYIRRIADVRGVPVDSLNGFRDMMVGSLVKGMPADKALPWTQRQAYIAMGFALEAAALLQIDATPMEGFDAAAYDKLLGLEGTGWRATAVVAFGYRHAEDGFQNFKKVRFAEEDLLAKI